MEIIERKQISLPEVLEILGSIENRTQLQEKCYELATKFSKVDAETAKKVIEELKNLDMLKLTDDLIIQIVNIYPRDEEDLDAVLKGSKIPFKPEEKKAILNILKKYLS